MFYYLSKALPPLVYPLGAASLLIILALFLLWRSRRWTTVVLVAALALLKSPAPPRATAEVGEAGDRMIYAASLYQQGVAPRLILSGGGVMVDGTAIYPEANAMAELLAILGVPADALILESRSRNTYENAVEVKRELAALRVERIGLVTSALHMPRSVAIFARQGISVTPLPTDYQVTYADWDFYTQPNLAVQLANLAPTAGNLDKVSDALKEYIGIAVYWLRGWL